MTESLHRVKLFVFRLVQARPDYLLVKSNQGQEGCWGPVHGPLGFGEKLESAIRREALDELGIARPLELIDLQMTHRWLLGDEDVIEWNYAMRAQPQTTQLRLDRRWSGFRWVEFGEAYPQLELDSDRAAILRLHTMLQAS